MEQERQRQAHDDECWGYKGRTDPGVGLGRGKAANFAKGLGAGDFWQKRRPFFQSPSLVRKFV